MSAFFNFLASIGLGEPTGRAIFGAALFSAPILLKSKICYQNIGDGVYIPKKFSLLADKDTPAENKTLFPWYIFPILGAILFGLFL